MIKIVGSTAGQGRGRSLHNDSEQVVHTHMRLPSNSINWYWRKRGKTGTPSEATRYPWSHDISNVLLWLTEINAILWTPGPMWPKEDLLAATVWSVYNDRLTAFDPGQPG